MAELQVYVRRVRCVRLVFAVVGIVCVVCGALPYAAIRCGDDDDYDYCLLAAALMCMMVCLRGAMFEWNYDIMAFC